MINTFFSCFEPLFSCFTHFGGSSCCENLDEIPDVTQLLSPEFSFVCDAGYIQHGAPTCWTKLLSVERGGQMNGRKTLDNCCTKRIRRCPHAFVLSRFKNLPVHTYPTRIRIHSSTQDSSGNIGNRACVVVAILNTVFMVKLKNWARSCYVTG